MSAVKKTSHLRPVNNRRVMARRISWPVILVLAFFVLGFSGGLFYLILTGKTRTHASHAAEPVLVQTVAANPSAPAAATTSFVPRSLDGQLVVPGQDAFTPRALMIDNQIAARPQSGLSQASLVIESPVEGGITRLLAFFDATTSAQEIGPVRSSRPYFIDWAQAWQALYFHVGGSPDALNRLQHLGQAFGNVDQMSDSAYFWRSPARSAPHNVYTSQAFMTQALIDRSLASSTGSGVWHFQSAATTTERGGVAKIVIGYPGSGNVMWRFDKQRDVYRRTQGGKKQSDAANGSPIEAQNIIVIKTDSRVLDEKGRLAVRTTGSGPAVAYRDGNKYVLRWTRIAGEPIRLEAQDGSEFLFDRGITWIEVTDDDRAFAGLKSKFSNSTSTSP